MRAKKGITLLFRAHLFMINTEKRGHSDEKNGEYDHELG